jgi:CheY-like chemotaxis protein/anti-sigma regulatory factor (Ser/Thr protein kinase)
MPIRVLLVDDVVEVRRLVRTALRFRGGFEVVGEASSGAEAVKCAADLDPDVTVLDLGLPDLAGHELLTRLREAAPRTKVVVFSGADASEHQVAEGQVEGYVLKDTQLDYLVDLLESVTRRQSAEAQVDLPRELTSVRLARRFVAGLLADWGLESLRDDALLVTSELAANAITHAHSTCRLRVSLNPTTLRIDVIDTGSGTPEPQPPSATEEHGRGLHLVAAVTTAWGLEIVPADGKVVWAELVRPA